MLSLEAACNEAQNLIDSVRSGSVSPQSVAGPSSSGGSAGAAPQQPHHEASRKPRVFNILQRLRELYIEECRNGQTSATPPIASPLRNLRRDSRLLEKLVLRENLNTLIVNLYPGNKGYSLSSRLHGKAPAGMGSQAGRSQGSEPVIETMRWLYSDEELLRCIDQEEIPTTLADLLEANHSELFYQGCVIAEVRDYRPTYPRFNYETYHVLLRPTTQSIINDVNLLSYSQDLSAEDRLSLESQMVLATAQPLCLDPNPAVGVLINNLHHKRHRLSTAPLKRTARKFSQVSINRKRKLDQFTAHNSSQLHDFIKAKQRVANPGEQAKKTQEWVLPPPPPVPIEESVPLAPPTQEPDVLKHAKSYEKPSARTDCTAHLIEEYILETERAAGRTYHISLTILQRYSNSEYLGELYVDRDYREGERNGASCRFVLGTRAHANRYIQQFTEIFTEGGRKSVRITHVIPGQQQRVSVTAGVRDRERQAAQPSANTQLAQGQLGVAVVPAAALNLKNMQVSQLSSLLNSTNVPGPPNVNVHQIQQNQNVGLVIQNSSIQSLLSSALTDSNPRNGPVPSSSTVVPAAPVAAAAVGREPINTPTPNATVHHQPMQAQVQPQPPQQQQVNVATTRAQRQPLAAHTAISALVNSLMNSAQQFQVQQAAQQAQANSTAQAPPPAPAPAPSNPPSSTTNSNPTILRLLNATTPLNISNNNVMTTSQVSLTQQSPKVLPRKTPALNLLNSRLMNQTSPTLVVNNTNPLRVSISSLANHLTQGTAGQVLNTAGGYAIATTTQGFANSQTFTITTPNATSNQAYSISAPGLGNLTSAQGQTFTLTPSPSQSFTISPASNNTSAGFTLAPAGTATQTTGAQPQTFTVLQPNQNQSYAIAAPVVTVNSQAYTASTQPVASQAFTITNNAVPSQTFTITTPVVTVGNQFVTCQSPAANTSPTQAFSPQNQVFTVNMPSPATSQNKNMATQSSVLLNKNQTFTINANNQNFTVTTPIISNNPSFAASAKPTDFLNNNSANGGVSAAGVNRGGRVATSQRRLSTALQHTSELNKLLSDRSGLIQASKHLSERDECRTDKTSKLSQVLSGTLDGSGSHSGSNLGLSMPGLSALLAGTPSADNPIPGASDTSSLLERLASSASSLASFTSPPPGPFPPQSPNLPSPSPNQNINFQNTSLQNTFSNSPSNAFSSSSPLSNLTSPNVPNFTSPSPKSQVQFQGASPSSKESLGITSPLSSPPGAAPVSLNLQGIGLQSIQGLQNLQVSIPGLAVPISLSLNVTGQPGAQGMLVTSLPLAATTNTTTTTTASAMVLTNSASGSGNILSLPVAQLVTSGVKASNQRGLASTAISLGQGTAQSIQLVTPLQRPARPGANQIQAGKTVQPIASRGVLTPPRPAAVMKSAGNSQISGSLSNATIGNQVLTIAAHQQLQLALQKQAHFQSIQCITQQSQKRPISPSTIASKHRRRSNTAETNK